jgi:hypothetical protein
LPALAGRIEIVAFACFSGLDLVATGFSRWLRAGSRFLARFSLLALAMAGKSPKKLGHLSKQRLKPRPRSRLKPGYCDDNCRVPLAEAGGNLSSRLKPATRQNF